MSLSQTFRDYCRSNITEVAQPLSQSESDDLINNLRTSHFKSVVQAYTVLDFYHYRHLAAEGFDTYFGYRNEEITADNILDMVHPEDQEAFGTLYYLCLEGLNHMPIPTAGIGHFCISYRMRDAWGKYHKILETNNIIACDKLTHRPLVNLAQISLMPGNRSENVQYYFNIRDEGGSVAIMQEFFSHYDQKINIFNDNELKIVRLLKAGHTSQAIADMIHLSKHSIDKYRKGLLAKTQTLNTPQLISYMETLGIL